jgi:hypothetical protein
LDERLPFGRRTFLSSVSASLSPNIRPSFVGSSGVLAEVAARNSMVWRQCYESASPGIYIQDRI